ncbi:uncharacterized protein [Paramisgurnus dabryanus]|uniref:uncharacterized protein n=1 Tax=Paramisgurnus dabryanus TaxID=90735 RepID=UPI003CCEFD7A
MFALPGAVADDEWSPEVVRQNTTLSTSAQGLVTGSGARDAQRRLSIATPAASQMIFALPRAMEDEEWSPEAHGLMTSSGERGAQQRLTSSAADRESIVSSGASVHHTIDTVERSTTFCVCHNEEDLDPSDPPDPSDPQPGPSGLEPCARRDHADLLKPTGYLEPGKCLSGSYTLEKTEIQEETGPKHYGPFDPEPRAQPDQTISQSCPFGLQRARKDNRQYSPFGLEPASYKEPLKCLSGSLCSLDSTEIQEETGPKHDGPFDPEPRAQPDQTISQSCPFGLQRARKDNRQYSPFGLEPASYKEPLKCLSGSLCSLDSTEIQEETGPKHDGPLDPEPRAQPDQTTSQPGPSGLQRAREDNRQYSPFGLEPASYKEPLKCLSGSLCSLDSTEIQEETGPKHDGPLDPEPRAQPDQTTSQPGPSGLQRAREDNRQYSPFGLEPASYKEPLKCLSGSLCSLDSTEIQEETGPKHDGPLDPEPRAQPDQTTSQPGPSGLQRAREDNRQYSPFGLEPASYKEPLKCHSGSLCSLDSTEIQEETGPKHDGPLDPEPRAQPDQTTSQPGPSGLQRAREDNRQYSPFGLEPAGYKTPVYCQASTSKQTDRQVPAKPEHRPCSEEEKSDEAEADPEPSDLQLNYRPGRIFKLHYEMGRHIGRGAFGNVFEGRRLSDNKTVAIKIIEKSFRNRYIELPDHQRPLVAEVAINLLLLKPKKSPHIVEMLDWFTEDHEHILVLENPAPCVTLTKFIRDKRRISEELARDFMHQAILGAKDCFRRGVYHGDIKLDNILINTDTLKLKLIDFGVSKLTKACTVHGVDKEKLGPCVANTICSLGALLYKILHGDDLTKPYYAFTKSDRARTSSKECEDFMDLCFQDDKSGRKRKPKLDDLLKHPWMMKK